MQYVTAMVNLREEAKGMVAVALGLIFYLFCVEL